MSLIAQRSIWDWGLRIAAEHGERNGPVLLELLRAAERRELPVILPDAKMEEFWREIILPSSIRYVRAEDAIEHRSLRLPPLDNRGITEFLCQIMMAASDVEALVARRLAARPTAISQARTSDPIAGEPAKIGPLSPGPKESEQSRPARQRRPRGPKPAKRTAVEVAMKKAIADGEMTLVDLTKLKEVALAESHRVSRAPRAKRGTTFCWNYLSTNRDKLRPSTNSDRRQAGSVFARDCQCTERNR
jgi:hypothetical protein